MGRIRRPGNRIPVDSRHRDEASRNEACSPGSIQECIATFEVDSLDEATALYEAMYEDLATSWEAKPSDPK